MLHAPRLLLTAGRAAIDRSIFCPPGSQQQTRSSGVWRPEGTDGQMDERKSVS